MPFVSTAHLPDASLIVGSLDAISRFAAPRTSAEVPPAGPVIAQSGQTPGWVFLILRAASNTSCQFFGFQSPGSPAFSRTCRSYSKPDVLTPWLIPITSLPAVDSSFTASGTSFHHAAFATY